MTRWIAAWATLAPLLVYNLPCRAQDAADAGTSSGSLEGSAISPPPPASGDNSQELAQKLSNPVSSLISVPLQQNIDFGAGASDGVKGTLNIQPVVPVSLGPDWNVIVRTILPIVYQADISAPTAHELGLGDTTQSLFFSPKHVGANGIIWGAGPALLYPTATDSLLGSDKWGLGPTIVVLRESGKSTYGLLANHIWSIGGNDARSKISATFLQPFYSHTTAKATTFILNTETSYDWIGDHWVVPINFTVAQLTKLGKQPIQFGIGARYYVEKPTGGPDWGIRLVLTLLFPK